MGAAGSSCENALADTINGLYETELIRPGKPLRVGETLAFFAVSGGWPSDDAPPIAPAANANCDNMFEPVC